MAHEITSGWPRLTSTECEGKVADDDWCVNETRQYVSKGITYTYCTKHAQLRVVRDEQK